MDSSFNKEAIKVYSEQYTERILSGVFQNKENITGEEILTITQVKQVNMFVLKVLFDAWNDELDKIKSPYFDYDSAAVKEAFTKFKNTLSRSILVHKDDFAPLLEKAVYDALLIIVSPYHYYQEELGRIGNGLSAAKLQSTKKFTKVNQAILNALIDKLEKEPQRTGNILDTVLEETDLIPDDISEYIEQFNTVHPIDFSRIYRDEVEENEPGPEVIEAEQEVDVDEDFFSESLEDIASEEFLEEEESVQIESGVDELRTEEEAEQSEEFEIGEEESDNDEVTDVDEESIVAEEIEEASSEEEPLPEEDETEQEIEVEEDEELPMEEEPVIEAPTLAPENDPFISLNDTFSEGKQESLADLHAKQGIDKIETNITLNQRFMFVNGLFDGDVDTFNNVIAELDGMNNLQEATNYIDQHFSHWDRSDEDVEEFIDLVKKRFV